MNDNNKTFDNDFDDLAMNKLESVPDPSTAILLIEVKAILDSITETLVEAELVNPVEFHDRIEHKIEQTMRQIEEETIEAVKKYKQMVQDNKEKAADRQMDEMLKHVKPAGSA